MNPALPSLPGLRLGTATAAASVITIIGGALGATPSAHPSTHAIAGSSAVATATEVLTTDVLPGLAGLASTPTAPGTAVQVAVTLANPNAAAQNALYNAIYTSGSAQYHHFLTAAQVAAEFGAPQAAFDTVKAWATRDGMRLGFSSGTREYLLFSGTAAQAEQTFLVTFRDYTRGGQHFYANANGPTVPANADVAGVIGLNSLLRSHTLQTKPAAAKNGSRTAQDTCDPSNTFCTGLTTPQDMWSIYGMPTNPNATSPVQNFGQGQQMAVLGEGATQGTISDLRAFETERGLPKIPVTITSVNDDGQDTSGTPEWDIDTQASTGMAPKASSETLYFAKDLTDPSVLGDFAAFQGDATGPMQANASFGECEQDPTTPATGGGVGTGLGGLAGTAGLMFTAGSEDVLQKATIEGKTLFSSTGDTGSSCPVVFAAVIGAGNGVLNQGYPETNYPASSRYVTAVGGTVLYSTPNTATPAPASNAGRSTEYSWTFTGGGNTLYIPEPAYQQGITMLDTQPCISQPNGVPYSSVTPCRGVPDVAAQSGDIATNGYAVTMGGTPDSAGGGTSLSSPLWMGMWTRIQAAATTTVGGQYTNGFANPALYKVGLNCAQDANDFFDIGGGGTPPNASPPTNNGIYGSLPRTSTGCPSSGLDPSGWDYTSGLGVPNVTNLGKDITGTSSFAPTNTPTVASPTDCGQVGLNPCVGAGQTCANGLWNNPPHTSNDLIGNSDPQLSLLHGAFSVSADGKTLRTLMNVTDLTETVPMGSSAAEWYFLWTYSSGSTKTTYFANAELQVTPGSVPSYDDGTVSVTGTSHSYNKVNTNDIGHFTTGTNGVVEIDVPLANVGNPPTDAVLNGPTGETDILIGAIGHGLLERVDTGGPTCDYKVGSNPGPVTAVASSSTHGTSNGRNLGTPNTGLPFPVIWPGLALIALGGAAMVSSRRRRRRQPAVN